MNYPHISDYIESILCAEDNFVTQTNLRPVLDEGGKPIMNSGNYAVVFKMQDITDKKLYAIKCFIKEQIGRSYAYKKISEELSKERSKHITNFQYLENELFVALSGDGKIEASIVKMEWIDGLPLDKYIEQHIDDPFSLTYLAYQFSQFTKWLLSRDFAHGDLKPDNLLVNSDSTIVMIDYDGMFMPSFDSYIVNEIGCPDYQHPSRALETFSKEIDDFSLLVILIEILYSNVHKKLCSPVFSKKDYNCVTESTKIKQIFPSVNPALNIAITELVNSLIENHINISRDIFSKLKKLIDATYYEASDKEYRRVLEEKRQEKGNSIWFFPESRGYRGEEENYPVMPSIDVIGYDYEHDGYPYVGKDGCLLQVYDYDGGSYMGDCWDEDWDTIVIPDNIITISDEAFQNCNSVRFIVLPNTIKSIGNNVFNHCGSLQYIVLPEKIERVGNHLLNLWPKDYIESKGCKNIELFKQFEKEIIDPSTNIDGYRIPLTNALLQNVTHQEYVDFIDSYNGSCRNFRNFLVPNGCKDYYQNLLPQYKDYILDFSEFINSDVSDVNPLTACIAKKIGISSTKIVRYKGDEDIYIIPSTVKTICSYAFAENVKLKKVIIPESVKSFGENVFKNCRKLESITLPRNLTSIPDGFLHGCVNLKEINLPLTVTSIGCDAFGYCKTLKQIQIPCGVIRIGDKAFSHCESLKSIILPGSVTKIGREAFLSCHSLSNVTLPDRIRRIGDNLFGGCTSLLAIDIPHGITTIPTNCFYECRSLRYVSLPNTIDLISNEAFYGCSELKSLVLPSSLKCISWGAFSYSGLEKISFPENIEKIEPSVFKQCAKLYSVEFPSSIKLRKIEKYLFEGCESLTELKIPECVEGIEEWAFTRCSHLRKITLPSHIKQIENGLFYGCINLEYVYNIENIVSIGQGSFFRCEGLKCLTLPSMLEEIGHNSFCGVNINNIDIQSTHFEKDDVAIYSKGKKILIEVLRAPSNWKIPDGVEEVRSWAFYGCRLSNLVIPNSVKELCCDAFVSCSIDRIEINSFVLIHHSTFCTGIKHIAVPKILLNFYKSSVLTPAGNDTFGIGKRFVYID